MFDPHTSREQLVAQAISQFAETILHVMMDEKVPLTRAAEKVRSTWREGTELGMSLYTTYGGQVTPGKTALLDQYQAHVFTEGELIARQTFAHMRELVELGE